MLAAPKIILGLVIFSLTFRHLGGPILVYLKTGQPINRNFTALPADYPLIKLPPTFPLKLYELEQLGFSLVGYLGMGADEGRVTGVVALLTNAETKTTATVATLFAKFSAGKNSVHYVEFTTEYEDGFEINTLNSPMVSILLPNSHRTTRRLPHLRHAEPLYRVHCYFVEQKRGAPVLPAPGDELNHLRASFGKGMGEQVELGYYFVDESAQKYRPTWWAAIRTTWRLLWPAKQIIQLQQDRNGRRLAQAAGVR